MIIDTHFHAFPGKFLDLIPEARNDVRGTGFHAFDHQNQILFGADYPHGRGGRDDQFHPMTLQAMADLDVPKADKEKIYYKNAQTLGF